MRAPWLEDHTEFEGVGAHELNRRYDHVDGEDEFDPLDDLLVPRGTVTPALVRAQAFMSGAAGRIDGSDTAHYQDEGRPPMDWDLVASRTFWHSRKVSQSVRYVDQTWARSAAKMVRVGIAQPFGYHWVSSTTDPDAQAAHFVATMGDWLRVIGAMGDCEEQPLTVEMVCGFYDAVEVARKRRFGIEAPCTHYTGAFVGEGRIFADPRIRDSRFGVRPVVLGAYTSRVRMLALPNVARLGIEGWQFSSNGRAGFGIEGRWDLDEILNRSAFEVSCRGRGATAPPRTPPEDVPPPIVVVPPVSPGPPPPTVSEEAPMFYVIDVPDRGLSAVVKLVIASGTPGHELIGFVTPQERQVWVDGGVRVVAKSGVEFDDLVASKVPS